MKMPVISPSRPGAVPPGCRTETPDGSSPAEMRTSTRADSAPDSDPRGEQPIRRLAANAPDKNSVEPKHETLKLMFPPQMSLSGLTIQSRDFHCLCYFLSSLQ